MVGYNVQSAVDTEHHLIVTHEVTMDNSDRGQLSTMARQARTEMGVDDLEVVADRGYFKSQEIKTCVDAGIDPGYPQVPDVEQQRPGASLTNKTFAMTPKQTNISVLHKND